MTVLDVLVTAKPPLEKDGDGVFRIGQTRVRLETVLAAFQQGCTPEAIAFKYPALALADIYAVIAYYLQHREEVEAYLAQPNLDIRNGEQEIEARFPSAGVRDRLLARRVGNG